MTEQPLSHCSLKYKFILVIGRLIIHRQLTIQNDSNHLVLNGVHILLD